MDEIQKLLHSWNLPKLFDILKEHEVNILALKCLTEKDICELIPKIGPRSIFRERLQEWRRENGREVIEAKNIPTETRKHNLEPSTGSPSKKLRLAIGEPIAVKLETVLSEEEGEEEFLENNTTTDNCLLEAMPSSPRGPLDEDYIYDTQMARNLKRKLTTASKDFNIESMEHDEIEELDNNTSNSAVQKLNVLEVLTGNFDGRKAFTFYKINNTLDMNHRRKIVTVIICAAIEQKINMYVETFDNIVKQILELFPKETYDTYFIPRVGTSCPKGALYNKYLNLSRQLRKDGLLEYRQLKRFVFSGSLSENP